MQVAAPEFPSLHVGSGHWNADDQALLDILLLADPLETPSPALSDVTTVRGKAARGQDDALKSKLSAVERRVRHREVVKRAYHRNKVWTLQPHDEENNTFWTFVDDMSTWRFEFYSVSLSVSYDVVCVFFSMRRDCFFLTHTHTCSFVSFVCFLWSQFLDSREYVRM